MGRMARRRWHARMRGRMMGGTGMGRHRTRRRRSIGPSRRRRCAGGQTHHGTAMRARRRRRRRWRWSFHYICNIAAFRKQKVLFFVLSRSMRDASFFLLGVFFVLNADGTTSYARADETSFLANWPEMEMRALPDQTSSGNDSIQKTFRHLISIISEPWVLSLWKRAYE